MFDVCDDAVMMTSELVSNAVRHGEPDVVIGCQIHGRRLTVSVSDCGSALPSRELHPAGSAQPNGRGLMIVSALAQTWGVRPFPVGPGKSVFFTLIDDQG